MKGLFEETFLILRKRLSFYVDYFDSRWYKVKYKKRDDK